MKKIKRFLKSNIKLFIGLIIGFVISGGVVSAAILFASDEVSYDNTTSGIQATNVQDAIDELYAKADTCTTWINPSILNANGYYINSAKSVIATSEGVMIIRNGHTHFFKINNYAEEQNHIQQVFSDISCTVRSSSVDCDASDFRCYVSSNGLVNCRDRSDNSSCRVSAVGSVTCT